MTDTERKEWHREEKHVMVGNGSIDWKQAEKYQKEHSTYNGENVLIEEVWRDADGYLCVYYVSSFGRPLNWFHYKINNGELEWW